MLVYVKEVGGKHENLRHMKRMNKGSDAEVFVHVGEDIMSNKRFG